VKSLLHIMRAHPLWSTVGTLAAALALVAVFAFVAPVRIEVRVVGGSAAQAAPAADIPTATPVPPPTATPAPPLPTATDEPPPLNQVTPTATDEPPPPTSSPAPPTPTDEPPAPTDEPPDDEDDPSPTPVRPSATPAAPPAEPPPDEPPPDVQIAKTSSVQRARPGDEFDYVLEGRNAGGSTAHDVVITDAMPAPLEILGVTSSKGDYDVQGQSVTVYPRTLEPGEAVRVVIRVRVRADAVAGEVRNLALIFTSTPGDPPPNRTDTPVWIDVPLLPPATVTTQQAPQLLLRMPNTADPDADLALLIHYLPLFALALVLVLAGVAAHYGAFRSRFVRVQLGYAGSAEPATPPAQAAGAPALGRVATLTAREVELAADPDELYARWRSGVSVVDLSAELAAQHPAVSKTQIAMVVRQLIADRQRA
jgi:uncharacterized repeat protein (TIGR01451 family)